MMNLKRCISATALLFLPVLAACGDNEPRGEPSPFLQSTLSGSSTAVLQLADGDTLHISAPVVAFYKAREYRQAWTDYDEITDRGKKLLATMGQTDRDGLDPTRYRFAVAQRMVQQVEEDSLPEKREPAQMARVDLALSEVFARYADALAGGTVDPTAGGHEWRIPRMKLQPQQLLQSASEQDDPEKVLATLRPRSPEYFRLARALQRYEQIEKQGGWKAVPAGNSAASAAALRARLAAEGDPQEAALVQNAAAGAGFDANLKKALVHFQSRHGLPGSGKLDKATLAALNTPVSERVLQLKLNMDRWRWLPRDLGDLYVLVNVAGFELEVVERDSAIMAMNVVVGQEGWETPIFRDTIESIIVNPYWNVPPSIAQEEIIPAVQSDPGYLERKGFERVGDGFRQKPGPQNALGEVKIIFPNKDDIYLHDTPAGQLFSESSRAFSHGCIRLEHPVELAKLLMAKATDTPPEKYEELRARESEQAVKLTKPVPVYILYFTAWAEPDGGVRFYNDVYEIDKSLKQETQQKLGRVALR